MWILHTYLLVFINEGFTAETWVGHNIIFARHKSLSCFDYLGATGGSFAKVVLFFLRGGDINTKITDFGPLTE